MPGRPPAVGDSRPRSWLARRGVGGAMSAMTDVSVIALTRTGLRLRRLTRRDLPKVLLFAHRGDPLPWTDEDLPEVLDSPDTRGCLAEVPGVVAGFVLGTV